MGKLHIRPSSSASRLAVSPTMPCHPKQQLWLGHLWLVQPWLWYPWLWHLWLGHLSLDTYGLDNLGFDTKTAWGPRKTVQWKLYCVGSTQKIGNHAKFKATSKTKSPWKMSIAMKTPNTRLPGLFLSSGLSFVPAALFCSLLVSSVLFWSPLLFSSGLFWSLLVSSPAKRRAVPQGP